MPGLWSSVGQRVPRLQTLRTCIRHSGPRLQNEANLQRSQELRTTLCICTTLPQVRGKKESLDDGTEAAKHFVHKLLLILFSLDPHTPTILRPSCAAKKLQMKGGILGSQRSSNVLKQCNQGEPIF